jgi:anaerobic ribonucleoside-triphosphate reductase activating protein
LAVEVADTEAEGPGRRYAIWVQGCPMRCPGCCNPELLPFAGGTPTKIGALRERVLAARERHGLEGVSFLGGEPFSQALPLAVLAESLRAEDLGVMVYTGHTLEELEARDDPGVARLLAATDLLVDGPYDRSRPDSERRWIGSTNQRLHAFGDRYDLEDPSFRAAETVELRLVDGQLIVNGWPWKGRGLPPEASKP